MLLEYDPSTPPSKKMDTLFYNAIQLSKAKYTKYIGQTIFRFIYIVIFYAVDKKVLQSTNQYIFTFMMVSMIVNGLSIFLYTYIKWKDFKEQKQNIFQFLTLAENLGHSTQAQINWRNGYKWENCVDPNIYNQTTESRNTDPQASGTVSITQQNLIANVIQTYKPFSSRCTHQLISLITIGLIIYGIVTLATKSPSKTQIIVLSIYLFFQAMCCPIFILAVLFILFLPILLCVCGCMLCWGGVSGSNIDDVEVPLAKQVTIRQMQLSGGSCSICLQNFSIGQKAITLPCDEKHLFHEICITTWLKASQTCPMCRTHLPQRI